MIMVKRMITYIIIIIIIIIITLVFWDKKGFSNADQNTRTFIIKKRIRWLVVFAVLAEPRTELNEDEKLECAREL